MIISFNTGKIETKGGGNLQQKRVEVTGNGMDVVVPDAGYDGLSTVYVKTNVGEGGSSEGYDFSDIGYDREINNLINNNVENSINYSKNISDNWDSSVSSLKGRFQKDLELTYFPIVETGEVTDFSSMFNGCRNLQYVPELNTSNATTLYNTFNNCSSLVYSPDLDTSKITNYRNCFNGCNSLKRLPKFSMKNMPPQPFQSTSEVGYRMFYDVANVTDFGGFVDCEHITYWVQSAYEPFKSLPNLENVEEMGTIKGYMLLHYSNKLTVESLMVFINALYDYTGNGETTDKYLKLGSTNLAKLTEEQISIATNKGWRLL